VWLGDRYIPQTGEIGPCLGFRGLPAVGGTSECPQTWDVCKGQVEIVADELEDGAGSLWASLGMRSDKGCDTPHSTIRGVP